MQDSFKGFDQVQPKIGELCEDKELLENEFSKRKEFENLAVAKSYS